jgi:hypothetical protein
MSSFRGREPGIAPPSLLRKQAASGRGKGVVEIKTLLDSCGRPSRRRLTRSDQAPTRPTSRAARRYRISCNRGCGRGRLWSCFRSPISDLDTGITTGGLQPADIGQHGAPTKAAAEIVTRVGFRTAAVVLNVTDQQCRVGLVYGTSRLEAVIDERIGCRRPAIAAPSVQPKRAGLRRQQSDPGGSRSRHAASHGARRAPAPYNR